MVLCPQGVNRALFRRGLLQEEKDASELARGGDWRRGCAHRGDALPARLMLQHEAAILTDPRRPSQEPERAGADRPPQPALLQLTLPRGPRSLKQGRKGSGVVGLREGQRENQGLRGLE